MRIRTAPAPAFRRTCAIITRSRGAELPVIPNLLIDSGPAGRLRQIASIGRAPGASMPLAAAEFARAIGKPLLVLARDPRHADQLEAEIRYFAGSDLPVAHFVEWETLPYDSFSTHQDIISRRLPVLALLLG